MPEDDELEKESATSTQDNIDSEEEDNESDLDLPDELKDTHEYRELMSLKRLRQAKLSAKTVKHIGYQVWSDGQSYGGSTWVVSNGTNAVVMVYKGCSYDINAVMVVLLSYSSNNNSNSS